MVDIKLNKHLHMVIPVEVEGGTIYIHSSVVSREVFENYYAVFSKAFNRIYAEGHGFTAPRIAKLLLFEVAKEMGRLDGPMGVKLGLMPEIKRLANVVMPGPRGWETVPFDDPATLRLLDEDDSSEVENAIVYFTLASRVHKKSEAKQILDSALTLWGAQLTSLSVTEYAAGLPTLTATVNTGERANLLPM